MFISQEESGTENSTVKSEMEKTLTVKQFFQAEDGIRDA